MVNEAARLGAYGNVVNINQREALSGGHTDVSGDYEGEGHLMANGGPPTREEIDAKLAAQAASWHGDISRLEVKLDAMSSFVSSYLPSRGYIAWSIVAAAFTVTVALVAINGLMDDRFEGGIAVRDSLSPIIEPLMEVQQERDKIQEDRLNQFIEGQENRAVAQEKRDNDQDLKLDQILKAVEEIRDKP